jgi:hypothetical protein
MQALLEGILSDQLLKLALVFLSGDATIVINHICGCNSVVECQLPKLNVVGSSPIVRFLDKSSDSAPRQGFWGLLFLGGHSTPELQKGINRAIRGNFGVKQPTPNHAES